MMATNHVWISTADILMIDTNIRVYLLHYFYFGKIIWNIID